MAQIHVVQRRPSDGRGGGTDAGGVQRREHGGQRAGSAIDTRPQAAAVYDDLAEQ